jgi:spermidine synthase
MVNLVNKGLISEKLYDFYSQVFSISNSLVSKQSKFQHIEIIENEFFGRILFLDKVVQTTLKDEFFYHEMFVHTPLLSHGNPKSVLIIGGGDGGILREVLKHSNIKKVVMVEIDEDVVSLSKQYLPSLSSGAFEDKRANVLIADGVEYVKNTQDKFDIVLIDSTDPISVGEGLFTKEFYQNVYGLLNSGGILVSQSGVPFYQPEELLAVNNKLKDIFYKVSFFGVAVPTYVGGFMCLSFAIKDNNLKLSDSAMFDGANLTDRFAKLNILNLKYYNPEIHLASFNLPEYIRNLLNK